MSIELRASITFCSKFGKRFTQTLQWMQLLYSDKFLSWGRVLEWYTRFKTIVKNSMNTFMSVRAQSLITPESIERLMIFSKFSLNRRCVLWKWNWEHPKIWIITFWTNISATERFVLNLCRTSSLTTKNCSDSSILETLLKNRKRTKTYFKVLLRVTKQEFSNMIWKRSVKVPVGATKWYIIQKSRLEKSEVKSSAHWLLQFKGYFSVRVRSIGPKRYCSILSWCFQEIFASYSSHSVRISWKMELAFVARQCPVSSIVAHHRFLTNIAFHHSPTPYIRLIWFHVTFNYSKPFICRWNACSMLTFRSFKIHVTKSSESCRLDLNFNSKSWWAVQNNLSKRKETISSKLKQFRIKNHLLFMFWKSPVYFERDHVFQSWNVWNPLSCKCTLWSAA